MMMPLSNYVESRQTSLSTITRHIKRLNLELPLNPNDKRQKLVSTENQSRLDASIGFQPAAAVETTVQPIEYYNRTEETGLVLAASSLAQAQITNFQSPDQNPLVQALKLQLQQMELQNAQNYQQMDQANQARRDNQAMVSAVDRLQTMQRAKMKAFNDHQLEQNLYDEERMQLDLQSRGFSPVVNQPPAPTLQAVPQSSSLSPEWL